MQKITNCR